VITIRLLVLQLLLSPELRLIVLFRLYSWLDDHGARLLAYVVYSFTRARTGCDLPIGARIGPGLKMDHRSDIVVGASVVAGSDLTIYNGVSLGKRRPPSDEMPTIGDRVTIGTGAKILGAVTVGDDAVIGANAVVLADVAPGSTVVGVPAHPVGLVSTGLAWAGSGRSAGVIPDL
jgi:serine O-acetyltransferase